MHFFPTVIGGRILRARSAYLTVLGIAGGTVLVALGFATRSDWLTRAGALAVLAGALALAVYAAQTWRTKSAWTGDEGWHRFAMGGLVSAIAWFEVGALTATSRLLVAGADPVAAGATPFLGPLVPGWAGLAVLASATHLVPAVGPGDPAAHARQRQLLGRWAVARLVAADLGVAALALGLPTGSDVAPGGRHAADEPEPRRDRRAPRGCGRRWAAQRSPGRQPGGLRPPPRPTPGCSGAHRRRSARRRLQRAGDLSAPEARR